jgi:hypothetical protein
VTHRLEDVPPDSPLLERYALDITIQQTQTEGGPMPGATQRALALAHREQFFDICQSTLWGNEDRRAFSDLLRGIVEAYLPETRWDLELLANIVDIQWKIRRTRRLQQSLFESGSTERDARGVMHRTTTASQVNAELEVLQNQLDRAVTTYRKNKR